MPHRFFVLAPFLVAALLLFPRAAAAQSTPVVQVQPAQPGNAGVAATGTVPAAQRRPRVGLVLSGGGGRGLSQIGVLRSLEKHGVPVDLIVGTSFGSVVGGLSASGYTAAEIESLALSVDWSELLSFSEETKRTDLFVNQRDAHRAGYLEIRFDGLEPIVPSSISGGQRLSNYFSTLTLRAPYHPGPSFDELKIPFRAIATDLVTGRRVVIDAGSLAEAMRASVTVPLLYAPLERDSLYLVDGGLVSNIPVDVADSLGCDVVIAVNTTSSMRGRAQIEAPWEVADQIMTIMMQSQNERQLSLADVVIAPRTGDRIASDFTGLDSLIAEGERAADEQMPALLALLDRPGPGGTPGAPAGAARHRGVHPGTDGIPLREGLKPSSIEFTGNSLVPDSAVADALNGPAGERDARARIENLLRLYRHRGFSLAAVSTVSYDSTQGILRVAIDEGRIAKIRYEGNVETKDYIIRREFPLEVGDVFTIDLAERGLTNIKSTGLFEYVLLDLRDEGDGPEVVLRVKERSSEIAQIGFRADEAYGFVAAVTLRDENFRGAWEDLSLTGRYGERYGLLMGEYAVNRIFNSYFTLGLRGYLKSREVDVYADDSTAAEGRFGRVVVGTYRENKNGVGLAFGSHFERLGDVSAELRAERHEIAAVTGTGYTPESYDFVSIRLRSVADTKDRYLFPTSGIYLALSYESASRSLGSDVGFIKIGVSWESYSTIFEGHTLHPRASFGYADQTLPLAEEFSLGGMNSFFGIHENDARGRQMLAAGLEYRWKLPFSLIFDSYLRARYDLGMVSAVPEELKLSRFRQGVGGELSLDTPLGEVSAGLGVSFFAAGEVEGAPVETGPVLFYFTIGPEF